MLLVCFKIASSTLFALVDPADRIMELSLGMAAQRGMTIADVRASLPVHRCRMHFLYLVETHQVTVAVGDVTSGMTTQLPQYLLESGWTDHCKAIACSHVHEEINHSHLSYM